ncbi:hypothetical protein [uncultured Phyllobacterium sp.]|uniref:hypothetical protein n=1 Tax=uncultured Phyllobacterium sp. TaxID=253813 RepID=UPI0025826797|nr:hypothetical protein [uncultured Phyllobacterium sp.]
MGVGVGFSGDVSISGTLNFDYSRFDATTGRYFNPTSGVYTNTWSPSLSQPNFHYQAPVNPSETLSLDARDARRTALDAAVAAGINAAYKSVIEPHLADISQISPNRPGQYLYGYDFVDHVPKYGPTSLDTPKEMMVPADWSGFRSTVSTSAAPHTPERAQAQIDRRDAIDRAIRNDERFNSPSQPSNPTSISRETQNQINRDRDSGLNGTRATPGDLAADRRNLDARQQGLTPREALQERKAIRDNIMSTANNFHLGPFKTPDTLGGISISLGNPKIEQQIPGWEKLPSVVTQMPNAVYTNPIVTPRPTPVAPVARPVAVPVSRPVTYQTIPIDRVPIPADKPLTFSGFFGGLVGAVGGLLNGLGSIVGGILGAIGEVVGGIFGGIFGGFGNDGGSKSGGAGNTSGSKSSGGVGSLGGSMKDGRNDNYGGGRGNPVLLDLSGNGLTVDALSSSLQFLDLKGDGYLHRTAWAGKGTGVLVIDTNNDGKINQSNEFVFTEWDKSATGDLEAIRNVFDTNHNGKLDAGDARWAEFKVMVDGVMKTLDELGIASIDLTPKGTGQNFADGSAITGTTEFTRTDGTKGKVGDAVLAQDPNGYIIKRTATTNADGTVTEDILAYNKDGSLAFRNLITRSADGNSIRTQFDDDGNGTFDRSQTDNLVIGGDGTRTRTISNLNADGSLLSRTVTVTSADGKTITTSIDQDGDGRDDQSEAFVTNADGSSTTTTRAFSVDGTLTKQIKATSSADGLSKTNETDANGDGVFELTTLETTVNNADGGRTKTVDAKNADGSLIARTVTTTSADNRRREVKYDHSGNGTFDETETTLIEVGGNGDITTTVSSFNADTSLRDKTITITSADGLSQTTSSDLTGDGVIDRVSSQVTGVGTDGTRTQTVLVKSGNGTLLSKSVTITSGDGKTISIDEDRNGDGAVDISTSVIIAADGSTTTTQSNLNPDGSLQSKTVAETLAGGLTTTTKVDLNADGIIDQIKSDVIVANADGSRTQTVATTSGTGALISKTITTTSADSLTQTVSRDINGDGTIDQIITNQIVLNADGSRSQTQTTKSGNGTLLSKAVTVASADRKTTTVTSDLDGDGSSDLTEVQVLNADGSKTITSTRTNAAGTVLAKSATTTSADGLTVTKSDDLDGNGAFDAKTSSTTVINHDGSRDTTVTSTAGTTLVSTTVTTTSANGLVKTVTSDLDGNGIIDAKTTQVSVLNADGSKTTTTSNYVGTSLTSQTIVITAANGLSSTTQVDSDGNGTIDRVVTLTKVLGADGSTVDTSEVRSVSGALLAKSVTTRSADGKTVTIEEDGNGDGKIDTKRVSLVNANGSTSETVTTFNPDGSLNARTVTEVTADRLTTTIRTDLDGNGTDDTISTNVTVLNADGSQTRTSSVRSADNSLISRTIITTSANGLVQTVEKDTTGDGVADEISTTTLVINADGSRSQTVATKAGNGTLLVKTVTLTSADQKTVTVTTDVDGDGNVDLTDVQVLNTDGSKTVTSTRTNSTGTLLAKAVTTTSADGLTITRSDDVDGNGTFDAKSVSTTVRQADGGRVTTVVTTSGTATTGKTITSISANGLVKSMETDLNGDGVIDTKVVETSVLNPDGSTTKTTQSYSGSSLTGKTVTTSSANGLVSSSQIDSDGNGGVDRLVRSTKAINADGSTLETTETLDNAGTLLSKSVTTTSADTKTVTTETDIDGDGKIDLRQVSIVNANGTRTQTINQFKPDGMLGSASIIEVSANGLSRKTSADANGDGIYEDVVTDVMVLNADGSRTQTIIRSDSNGKVIEKTITTFSKDGLSRNVPMFADGEHFSRSMIDTTALSADGSSVRTLNYYKSDASLESKTTTTISGDGRTTTVLRDTDGDGKDNQKEDTVKNPDGSVTSTRTDYAADGTTIIDTKKVTTSANGLIETTDYDSDGNGTVDTRTVRTTVLYANGSKTHRTDTFAASGAGFILKGREVVDISSDGLAKNRQWDLDGDGVLERSQSETTVLNSDGSNTQTIVKFLNGVFNRRHIITTSADGLMITTKRDSTGSGAYDQIATDATTLNNDGTKTRTINSTKADGSLISKTVTTQSADGRTITTQEDRAGQASRVLKEVSTVLADGSVINTATTSNASGQLLDKTVATTSADKRKLTIERDADGDGKVDQTEHRIQAVDGSVTSTITGLRADGTIANRTTAKVSADGLTTTTEWDLDGDGATDRKRTTISSFNADGSQRSVITDTDDTGKLVSKTTVTVSADGRTRTTSKDTNGNGTADQTETRIVEVNGAITETVVNNAEARELINLPAGQVNWVKAIAAKVQTTISLDGITRIVSSDYDGNGTYEVYMLEEKQLDGSTKATITETNVDGSVKARGTLTTSADGLTTVLVKDGDNDGYFGHTETSVTHNDGSITLTVVDTNTNGSLKQTVVDTITASGKLLRELTTDGQGRKTAETLLANDGTSTASTFDAPSGQTLSIVRINKKGVPTTATLYDPLNANPWVRVEQTFNAAGQKISETQYMDDSTRADITYYPGFDTPQLTNFYNAAGVLTGRITYDFANTQPWSKIEQTFDSAGRVTYQVNYNRGVGRIAYTYDVTNAQPWSRIEQTFDTADRLTYQDNYYDDGTRWLTTFDAANAQTWSRVEQNFDAAGRLAYQNNVYRNGWRVAYTWDQANAQSWSRIEQTFDPSGLVYQNQFNRDGTRLAITFDPSNSQPWSRVDQYFDTADRKTYQLNYNDDGTRTAYTYDAANTQSWSSVTQNFNTGGQKTNETWFSDDGSRTEYTFDPGSQQIMLTRWFNSAGALTGQATADDVERANAKYVLDRFDAMFYMRTYPDVVGRMGMLAHFMKYGWKEGRLAYAGEQVPPRRTFDLTQTFPGYLEAHTPSGDGGPGSHGQPVLLDLNGDNHIDLRPFDAAEFAKNNGPRFDWDGDGVRDGTAWVGPQDGMLAIDLGSNGQAGGDGVIDQAREIAFSLWATPEDVAALGHPASDLEGLRLAFDTNHDGVLDDKDARWNEFRVWQDANQNGISDPGELKTMSEAGIKLINLIPSIEGATQFPDGSALTGTSSYEMLDGTTRRLVGDATLAYRSSQANVPAA